MRDYKLVDWLTQGYLAVVALLVLVFHDETVPGWGYYLAGHGGLMVVVHALVRSTAGTTNRALLLLRTFYPLVLFSFFYTETHWLDGMVFAESFDRFVLDIDHLLFGEQPSRTWMQRFDSVWISEVFYAAYFSYYPMIVGVGVWLWFARRGEVCRYVTTVALVFYSCYLVYILFPVMGPHGADSGVLFTGRLDEVGPRVVPEAIRAGPFYKVMDVVYRLVEPAGGAAFPSSHVAVSVTTLAFTWPRLPRFRWLHLGVTVLLCLSTVYCGYHWFADVPAGLLTAGILVPLSFRLHRARCRPSGDPTCAPT